MIHFKRRINDGCTAFQKLAKSEEEDVVGNYFKPIRASRLMAQAQETQRGKGNLNLDFTKYYFKLDFYQAVWSTPNFSSSGGLVWDSFAAQHQFPRGTLFIGHSCTYPFVLELHTVRNLHFMSKNSTLISRELSIFWVKNSWKCCGFGIFGCWQLWFHEKNCQKNFGWKTRENVGVLSKLNFWTKIWLFE